MQPEEIRANPGTLTADNILNRNEELDFHPDPFVSGLFRNRFDPAAVAAEYTFGHSRKYTRRQGPDIMYIDNGRDQKSVALGHSFKTNAIRMSIDSSLLSDQIERVHSEMSSETGHGARLQFIRHLLLDRFDLQRFRADHILRLVVRKGGSVPVDLSGWIESLSQISSEDVGDYESAWTALPMKRDPGIGEIDWMVDAVGRMSDSELRGEVDKWALRTISNSLGIVVLQAAREMSGVRDEDIGYHVDMPRDCTRDDLEKCHIWLYDRTPDGNGACDTVRKWFHIPSIVREVPTGGTPSEVPPIGGLRHRPPQVHETLRGTRERGSSDLLDPQWDRPG